MSYCIKMYFLLLVLILIGCDNMNSSTNESANIEIRTELGILPKLISLPRQPLSVKWEIRESKEKGTGYLRALLEFNPEDSQYIIENSKHFESQTNDRINVEFYEEWLPEKIKSDLSIMQEDKTYVLLGVKALQPNLFIQTKLSPYVNGSITPFTHGYILVSLYSM